MIVQHDEFTPYVHSEYVQMRSYAESNGALVVEIEEGPWGVYDCYCLACSFRYIGVAPVQAEAHDLWECSECRGMTVTHTLIPADEGDDAETA